MTGYSALTRANYLALVRDRTALFFTFIFPLFFLVSLGMLFGQQDVAGGGRSIDYIAPGVMCWGVGNGAVFGVSFMLVNWRTNDVLRLVRMTPVRLPAVLGARGLVTALTGVFQAVVFLLIGHLPFLGLRVSPTGLLLALPVVLLGVGAFFALGLLIGTYAASPDAVSAIGNCVMVPMAFLSGSFFPLASAPHWLRIISLALPLRYMTEGIGSALRGGGAAKIAIPCLALAAFTVAITAVTARVFRWTDAT